MLRCSRILPLLVLAVLVAAPAGAQATPSIRWHRPVRIEPSANNGVQAVSCPSTRLCVAVDASGHVIVTTRPTGGNGSWSHATRIDGTSALTGVSCPTTKLCVAVDENGNVLTSTHPTRGAASWSRPTRIDSTTGVDGGPAGLVAISCPSTSLCVAADGAASGRIVSTTRPLAGARAWRQATLGGTLAGVSCASSTLCVAAGSSHFVSIHPAGARSAWRATGAAGGGGIISAIDCPTLSLCAGAGYGNGSPGVATATANPRGGASAWRTFDLAASPPAPNSGLFDAAGCAGRSLCIVLDTADNAYVSATPATGGWRGPTAIRRDSASQQNAVDCTTSFCVVVDSAGVETTGIIRG